jgi:phosphate transport system permease protein
LLQHDNKGEAPIKLVRGDTVVTLALAAAACFIITLLAALAFELFVGSSSSLTRFGPSFLIGTKWDPDHNVFGALPFIYGTLLTSAIAIVIGLPISLGIAIFISEKLKAHRRLGYALGTLVDLLAAVPSVIYGLWALIVLSPFLFKYIETPLNKAFPVFPLFAGTPLQTSFFTAGIILAIMIIPTISAVSRDVLNAVPNSQREAMYSIGATDWEVTWKSVLPYARSGIFGAFILGLGRAVGETIAVTMVIGNTPKITANIFSGGYTLASLIANSLGEAQSLYRSAIIEIALILFFVALAINIFARFLLWRMTKGRRVKA